MTTTFGATLPSPAGATLHSPAGAAHARISGIGAYRPRRVVPNAEVIDAIDSSDQWIQERSGIKTRHIAGDGESVIDMAQFAANDALTMAGLDPTDVDTVVVATVTHLLQTPAAAPILAERMGMGAPAAFDISAACAGYCHAIGLAQDMIRGGSAGTVLVVGVERLSDITDRADRGTAFIFGDGAGAAVVTAATEPGIGPTIWGCDGSRADVITQRANWMNVYHEQLPWPALTMQGQSVFRWAVWSMAPIAQRALDAAGVSVDQLGAFIPHQANLRIIEAMAKQLNLPDQVVIARDIVDSANTSSASIPLAAERLLREGLIPGGALALQIGYGAGLAYAAQVIRLPTEPINSRRPRVTRAKNPDPL